VCTESVVLRDELSLRNVSYECTHERTYPLLAVPLVSDVLNKYNQWHPHSLNAATPLFRNVLDETFGFKVISRSIGFRNHEPITY
jgi:hypothetical protein